MAKHVVGATTTPPPPMKSWIPYCFLCCQLLIWEETLVDPMGGRDAPPPSVQFLSFSCSFRGKILSNIRFLVQTQGLALPPSWKILDPPLADIPIVCQTFW